MKKNPKRIAVTGACGQIAYSLIFKLAAGELFSSPFSLSLLDIPGMEEKLEGIAMELDDCTFPLIQRVKTTTDPREAFDQADLVFLVGAKPRSKGMERKDLLQENGAIFVDQGNALNERAARICTVLVVGNPANTNALVAMHHAPDLPKSAFHALTRLDQNRAVALLAKQANAVPKEVEGVTIWGNHSNTQVPDFTAAVIRGKKAEECLERKWLEEEFMKTIQTRGAKVIEKLGRSSAASAAQATLHAAKDLFTETEDGRWFSSAILSDQNPYGIEEGLVFGFPCISTAEGFASIKPGLEITPFIQSMIEKTQKELIDERELCKRAGFL